MKGNAMAKREDVFPSKYLRAGDLNGKAAAVWIASAPMETLKGANGEERKTVLYFRGKKKVLPLNRTNWDAVAAICGEDTDDWPGEQIELFPTQTEMKGEMVDCIRIRRPRIGVDAPKPAKPVKPVKPAADDDMDDEIPF
jgi:hypothetical protein